MTDWRIHVLYYGEIECTKDALTQGIDVGLPITLPYLGFLLNNGNKKILVDTGINERFIIDGKAWGGYRAKGGTKYVKDSLAKLGIKPDDIDTVVYTHLHNDHTGASDLFSNAVHIFQWDEWLNLLDPLPSQQIRGDFDPETIPALRKMNCIKIDGDVEIEPGINAYKTPGHTAGSMIITVATQKGLYVLAGDVAPLNCMLYPKTTSMTLMNGKKIKITPAPDVYGPAIPSSLIYDHYAWYRSINLLKTLVADERYAVTGHDPSLLGRVFPE